MTEMTASVTLSLRDQLSGGLNEVLDVLREIRDGMSLLREATVAVQQQLSVLADGFKPAQDAAKVLVDEVKAVGAAARVSAGEVAAISEGARVGAGNGGRPAAAAAAAGAGAGSAAGGGGGAAHAGGSIWDLVGEFITAAFGVQAIKANADFTQYLGHIAITEGLHGHAAATEVARLRAELQPLALKTGTSSLDLAQAYFSLITQHIPAATIDQVIGTLATASTAYNTPVADMSQGVFALTDILHIPPSQLGLALTELALAGKQAHFGFGDFSRTLPGIGAQAAKYGAIGLPEVAALASQLEIVVKASQDPAQAASSFNDLLMYLSSPMAARMFGLTKRSWSLMSPGVQHLMEKYGIHGADLPKILNDASKHGIDPVTAVEQWFQKILAPVKSPTDRAEIIGAFLHNQGAQQAMIALLEHPAEQARILNLLRGTKPGQITTDFGTAMGLPEVTVKKLFEELAQLTRLVGSALTPELRLLNDALAATLWVLNLGKPVADFMVQIAGGALALKTLIKVFDLGAGQIAKVLGLEVGTPAASAIAALSSPLTLATGAAGAGLGYLAYADAIALQQQSKTNAEALDRNTAALDRAGASIGAAIGQRPDGTRYVAGPGGITTLPPLGPVLTPGFHGSDQTLGRP